MNALFLYFFGCFHSRTTFPITLSERTYVTCLDCGKEMEYDWEGMGAAQPSKPRQLAHVAAAFLGIVVFIAIIAVIAGMPQ